MKLQATGGSARAEGPRERLACSGPEALSNPELLALLFRTGTRERPSIWIADLLWRRFGSWESIARAGDAELVGISGIGPAKLASLRAALEIGVRVAVPPIGPAERILGPEEVYRLVGPRLGPLRQECFVTLLLDARQRLLRQVEVSRGSLDQSLVHPREVFSPALRESAASMVLVHNHPSGDPEPSQEDRIVTHRLVEAGQLLGIPVVDHVVVARRGYTSFGQRGWLAPQVVKSGGR